MPDVINREAIDKATVEAQKKVNAHLRAIKKAAFEIKVQVLQPGDTYNIKTADGEKTITVENAGQVPSKKLYTDAGFDLFTPERVELAPGEVKKIPLNIRMHIPAGAWGRIETKSGHGSKGQLVYAGVIDQDYRGVPHVILANLNNPIKEWFKVDVPMLGEIELPVKNDEVLVWEAGEKIAQLTMNNHSTEYYMLEVPTVDTATERGEGGFGSTGAKA